MRLEDRLHQHLNDQARRIPTPPNSLEQVERRGHRRIVGSRVAMAAVGLAAVAGFVAVSSMMLQGEAPPVATSDVLEPPVETTLPIDSETPTSVAPTPSPDALPTGYLAADDQGVTIGSLDGVASTLTGDPYYEAISSVLPDGEGGILFTHVVTPVEWPQGSIVRLAPGATRPEIVAEPVVESVPLIPIVVLDGTLYYRSEHWLGNDSRVFSVPIDRTAAPTQVADVTSLHGEDGWEVTSVSVARTGLLVVASSGSCSTITGLPIFGGDGPEVPESAYSCSQDGPITAATMSPSGRTVFVALFRGGDPTVRAVHLDTNEIVEVAVEGWGLHSTTDESVVVSSNPPVLIEGGTATPIAGAAAGPVVVPSVEPLDLADGASLGSGTGAIPCEPITVVPLAIEGPIGATINAIREAAAACDYESLSEMAERDGVTISFGGAESLGQAWVQETRILGVNPRGQLLAVTEMDPAQVAGDPAYVVWPAVTETNSDADWAALVEAGIYSDGGEIESMRDAGGYLGYRVGVANDGRWLFAVAGD